MIDQGQRNGSRPTVIVIAGWDRSGSTILANILGSVPGVVTLGEVANLWSRGFLEDLICGCGQRFSTCGFWSVVRLRAFGDAGEDAAHRAVDAMGALEGTWMLERLIGVQSSKGRVAAARYRALLERVYLAAATPGVHAIVDSSKKPWHALIASQVGTVDVRILQLVRDPRGVAFSHRKRIPYDPDVGFLMDRHALTRSAASWIYRNQLIRQRWHGSPEYKLVRYEDLVEDPRGEVERILRWIGVDAGLAPFIDEHTIRLEPIHNISGNPSRFEHGDVEIRSDEAWRHGLGRREQRYVQLVTWPYRSAFGYSGPGSRVDALRQSGLPGMATERRPSSQAGPEP